MPYYAGLNAIEEIQARIATIKKDVEIAGNDVKWQERKLSEAKVGLAAAKAMLASYEAVLVKLVHKKLPD